MSPPLILCPTLETSSAKFIHQRYTAASSGQKLQNSIISAYGEAQDDH
ncbi:unnamed protein product [Brassica oleracea]